MTQPITPEAAAAYLRAQGVETDAHGAGEAAKFAATVLEKSARALGALDFEDEPAGYAAAQRRHAP